MVAGHQPEQCHALPATARASKPYETSSRRRPDLGIGTLTLYTFSSDNWQRPSHEVSALMRLFRSRLTAETPKLRREQCAVVGHRPS